MQGTTLLVTGGAGHTGRHFLERLARAGWPGHVRAVARSVESAAALAALQLDLDIRRGDLADPAFAEEACRGVDTVLHIAGIHLSETVVAAGTRAGVGWFVLVHTTGRFSRFKAAAADYVRIEDGLLARSDRLTVLRPTMIYGSARDRNMWRLIGFLDRHRVFPVFGSGRNLMQPVHAPDLAAAYHGVLLNRASTFGRQYDLPGREALSYIDLLRTVSQGLGRRTIFVRIPLSLSIAGAAAGDRLWPGRFPVSVEQVRRMGEDKAFDWSPAARDFGYAPAPFVDGIATEIALYRGG